MVGDGSAGVRNARESLHLSDPQRIVIPTGCRLTGQLLELSWAERHGFLIEQLSQVFGKCAALAQAGGIGMAQGRVSVGGAIAKKLDQSLRTLQNRGDRCAIQRIEPFMIDPEIDGFPDLPCTFAVIGFDFGQGLAPPLSSYTGILCLNASESTSGPGRYRSNRVG